ncbi:hypothetical protein DMC30DRAFT_397998 [Rhodotorula diobovata]|uniref:Uncharacterized protein n=1 Tax=Rhodotorula diobovata TaxID=5288 RepID=A0A5C5FTS2_9BASI|nr:hypothetical protein DMC30DRAFT_397998 [Rhodotorula diobovata]
MTREPPTTRAGQSGPAGPECTSGAAAAAGLPGRRVERVLGQAQATATPPGRGGWRRWGGRSRAGSRCAAQDPCRVAGSLGREERVRAGGGGGRTRVHVSCLELRRGAESDSPRNPARSWSLSGRTTRMRAFQSIARRGGNVGTATWPTPVTARALPTPPTSSTISPHRPSRLRSSRAPPTSRLASGSCACSCGSCLARLGSSALAHSLVPCLPSAPRLLRMPRSQAPRRRNH